jgi:hypothetical protein
MPFVKLFASAARRCAAFVLLAACLPLHAVAQPFVPGVAPLSPSHQTVGLLQQLANPFSVRVTGPGALPIAGVRVTFTIDTGVIVLPPPGYFDRFGSFASGYSIELITDANGVVTAPTLTAGSLPNTYPVYVFIPAQTVGQSQLLQFNDDPFTVTQGSLQGGTSSIPALSVSSLALLAALAVAMGIVAMRRQHHA